VTNLDVSLGDVRFVVVDVESTGGTSGEHRLIEIAMIVLQDGMIVDRHASLVNPHESIPDFIQRMTGITEAMVEGAPEEAEAIAPVLAALDHPHAVFVAHNVGFDWGFVQRAIERQGRMVPPIARLCTVKLSRRIHTDLARHDLASVSAHCQVEITDRHRAMGDTEATVEVLRSMLQRAQDEHQAATLGDLIALQYTERSPARRDIELRQAMEKYLRDLPDAPGVYSFLSSKRNVLYVGTAQSLATQVRSYFADPPVHGRRVHKMLRYAKHIRWKQTGTYLGAMLLEARERSAKRPAYNTPTHNTPADALTPSTVETPPEMDVLIAVPSAVRTTVVDLLLLRGGRVVALHTVQDTLDSDIADQLRLAAAEPVHNGRYTPQELEQLRIITSWINTHKPRTAVAQLQVERVVDQARELVAHARSLVRHA